MACGMAKAGGGGAGGEAPSWGVRGIVWVRKQRVGCCVLMVQG